MTTLIKTIVSSRKNVWERLEIDETIASKYFAVILNTEGWLSFKDNDEFADEALEEL